VAGDDQGHRLALAPECSRKICHLGGIAQPF
jgi:hypothetical protein